MRKQVFLIAFIYIFSSTKAQQVATLLYNWDDPDLIGSFMYDNTYNECWGLVVNDREFAVIGSTSGTHIFDITQPEISSDRKSTRLNSSH